MRLLKPCRCLPRRATELHPIIDVFAKCRIRQDFSDLFPRNRLQYEPRILRKLPQGGIQPLPELVGGMIPRPTQIQRKLGKRFESRNIRRRPAESRSGD